MKRDLDFSRLEALEEWEAITERLKREEKDYLECALRAGNFPEKEFYRGLVYMIRRVMELPEMITQEENILRGEGRGDQGEKAPGEKATEEILRKTRGDIESRAYGVGRG